MKSFIYKLIALSILMFPFASYAGEDFCASLPTLSQNIILSIENKADHVQETRQKSKDFFVTKRSEISNMEYSNEAVKKVMSQNVAEPKNFREKISRYTFEKHLNNMAQTRHSDVLSAHEGYYNELESLIEERTEIIESGLESAVALARAESTESVDLCNQGNADLAEDNFMLAMTEVKQTLRDTVLKAQEIKTKMMEAKNERDLKIKTADEKFDSSN